VGDRPVATVRSRAVPVHAWLALVAGGGGGIDLPVHYLCPGWVQRSASRHGRAVINPGETTPLIPIGWKAGRTPV
jgi:hypothetical protein